MFGGTWYSFSMWHLWVLLTITLLIAEVFSSGFYLVCIAGACLLSAIPAIMGADLKIQIGVFAVGGTVILAYLRPILLKYFCHPDPDRRTNFYAIVGRTGTVVEPVGPSSAGRVRVGGEDWRALPVDAQTLAAGEKAVVEKIEGSTLYIHPPNR
jgi:membrane protein implicated in regulation of membrane protease activity